MLKRGVGYLLVLMVVSGSGCSASTHPLNFQPVIQRQIVQQEPVIQQGKCSWYGPGFHGRRTSNGEKFNKNALTAAHRFLPFGSEIDVTDTKTGRTVRVRINDRGPFIKGRVLDLSYAAAKSLGIVEKGVSHVQIRLVKEV